jgi:hypothetical protein
LNQAGNQSSDSHLTFEERDKFLRDHFNDIAPNDEDDEDDENSYYNFIII